MTLGPGGSELEVTALLRRRGRAGGFLQPRGTSGRRRLHAALEARWAQGCLPWGWALGALSLGSRLGGLECRSREVQGTVSVPPLAFRAGPQPLSLTPSSTTTSKSLGLLRVYPGAPLPQACARHPLLSAPFPPLYAVAALHPATHPKPNRKGLAGR